MKLKNTYPKQILSHPYASAHGHMNLTIDGMHMLKIQTDAFHFLDLPIQMKQTI